jgi:hypothetical protein
MVVVAFILTAIAGIILGIWLSAKAADSQPSGMNPVRLLAFTDVVKQRTIEAYADELTSALRLKFPDEVVVSAESVATFIDEYTVGVLEYQITRR